MFTAKPWPLWNGYCSSCGTVIKAWKKVRAEYDPKRSAMLATQQAKDEAERAEVRRRKLATFTTNELWMELHERLTRNHIAWWEEQGIPQSIQRDLHIGFTPDKGYYSDDEDANGKKLLLHSPAYTIPWFGLGFEFKTMQYRLFNDANRRYIFEKGLGGGQHYYMTTPSEKIQDKVVICEGVKKGLVAQFWLIPDDSFTVIAASSNNTFGAALDATKHCSQRFVVMDPGSEIWEKKAVGTNSKTTRAISFQGKIDDMWKEGSLDRYGFSSALTKCRVM
jgi:hypothetical protein